MNLKTWIPLLLAVALGLAALFMANSVMTGGPQSAKADSSFTSIVVTKLDVPPGTQLTAEMLGMGRMASDSLPEGAATEIEAVVGRASAIRLSKGQPVLETVLAQRGAGIGLAALIPDGMRAITIEVNEFSGLAGMVYPGARVDLVATINSDGATDTVARAIVQNVLIQAVGAQTQPQNHVAGGPPPEPVRSVTIVATPREVEAIELIASTSRPRLVLRSGLDNAVPTSVGVTFAELRGKRRFAGQSETMPIENPSTSPSNQHTDPFEGPGTRTIRIIRAGVESVISVEAPAVSPAPKKPSNTIITGTNKDELNK
jgi:pilus assembly protein CpaB